MVTGRNDDARSGQPVLEVHGLSAGYGRMTVVHDIDLVVGRGEVVGVLGANGAGKTTLMRAISGVVTPTRGEVKLQGEAVQGKPDYVLARSGIGHVLSGRELFPEMTVADNVAMGGLRLKAKRRDELLDAMYDLFPALRELSRRPAGRLSGGQQQMVAIGRALMTDPKLLLLDEPSTGLAPTIVDSLFASLRRWIEGNDMGVILVEQNATLAMRLAHRAHVLRHGHCVLTGTADELTSEQLIDAYLGPDGTPAR